MTARLAWVEIARGTDVGRVRGHNEDRHLVRPPVIAVADGMGGAQAGEVAAGMAVAALDALPETPRPGDLRRAVERANSDIRRSASGDAGRAGMGTTVTACLLGDDGRLYVVHVGDSRAYLVRDGELRRLTDDHSVVAELVRSNALEAKPEQIKAHIEELAASYEKPEDVVRWYTGDRRRMAEVEAVVIENNVTDFVLSKAKVNEKALGFDELMGQS